MTEPLRLWAARASDESGWVIHDEQNAELARAAGWQVVELVSASSRVVSETSVAREAVVAALTALSAREFVDAEQILRAALRLPEWVDTRPIPPEDLERASAFVREQGWVVSETDTRTVAADRGGASRRSAAETGSLATPEDSATEKPLDAPSSVSGLAPFKVTLDFDAQTVEVTGTPVYRSTPPAATSELDTLREAAQALADEAVHACVYPREFHQNAEPQARLARAATRVREELR